MAAGSAAAQAKAPPTVLSAHRVSLRPGPQGTASIRVGTVTFPRGARQGRPTWYLLRFRGRLLGGAPGECILTAVVNTWPGVQLLVSRSPNTTSINELDHWKGARIVRAKGPTAIVDETNYLTIQAVRGGKAPLSLEYRVTEGKCLRGVEVLPGTAVRVTRARPDQLILKGPPHPIVGHVGKPLTIPFRLTRRGGRPDRPVVVQLGGVGTVFTLSGSGRRTFPSIGDGRTGTFTVVPKRAGEYFLVFGVPRIYNQPNADAQLVIKGNDPGWDRLRNRLGLAAAVFLLAAAVLLWRGLGRKPRAG